MPASSTKQIDKAIEYIYRPHLGGFDNLYEAIEVISNGFENKTIELHLIPNAVDGLIRALMQIDLSGKEENNIVFKILRRVIQKDSDDAVVEEIIQALIAAPKPNTFIDYARITSLLSTFLQDESHPSILKILSKNIAKNLGESNGTTNEIIVRVIQDNIKEHDNFNQTLTTLIFSVFELGSYWACFEILESLLDRYKKGDVLQFQVKDFSPLWKKVKEAIYDKDYSPGNFQFIQSSAELLAILSINNNQQINELPEPLNDLHEPAPTFMLKGGTKIRYLILLSNAIEDYYAQVSRKKHDDDFEYYFHANPQKLNQITNHYFGDLYKEWHTYWAEKDNAK